MAKRQFDIHKAAAVLLQDRKVLLTRSRGKDIFVSPGGKLEPGETEKEACIRELKEELGINVSEDSLEYMGTFYAQAAGSDGKSLKMSVYMVKNYAGNIVADNEIEEVITVRSEIPDDIEVGSIFLHDILPRLKQDDLID